MAGKIKGKSVIAIYDINGRKVTNLSVGQISSNSYSTTVDVSQLKKGIYVIEVQVDAEKKRSKLVIQ